ncbi:hypothetical protein TcasGA2_TC015239 [Tribolium castaneum]|uniref:Uncharacterized protein n=1 Tax=Tribolium castaneum TaxID=7070 RepID=D2A567_TRICA|nr:hypothetical protein TcasGA2_TC015239 [Tribolium castaneum]
MNVFTENRVTFRLSGFNYHEVSLVIDDQKIEISPLDPQMGVTTKVYANNILGCTSENNTITINFRNVPSHIFEFGSAQAKDQAFQLIRRLLIENPRRKNT